MADKTDDLIISISTDLATVRRSLKRLETDIAGSTKVIERQFDGLGKRVDSSLTRSFARAEAGMARLGKVGSDASTKIAQIFAVAASAKGAQSLIDSAIKIQNSLKVAGVEGDNLKTVYDSLFASAQRNGAPLEALSTLYGRTASAAKELGASQSDLIKFNDTVAISMRASGQSATESAGALLQLSQALGGSVIQATEYNSLIDGARPLLQAVAAGIDEAGGSVSKLTALVKDGKISNKAFFDGAIAGAPLLAKAVESSEQTISSRFVRLQNVLIDAAGKFNESAKAGDVFGKAIDNISSEISSVDFAKVATQVQAIADALNSGTAGLQSWAEYIGKISGLDNIGKTLAGPNGRSAFGGALTLNSTTTPEQAALEVAKKRLELEKQIADIKANPADMTGPAEIRLLQAQIDALPKALKRQASITMPAYALPGGSPMPGTTAGGATVPALDPAKTIKPIKLADYKVDDPAEKKRLADAYRDLIKSADDRLGQLKQEIDLTGKFGIEAETARFKLDLLQASEDKGRSLNAEQNKAIEDKVALYKQYSETLAKAKLSQDLLDERRLNSLSPQEQKVYGTLQQYGLPKDLNSPEANQIRQQLQVSELSDGIHSFFTDFSQALQQNGGDIGDALGTSIKSALLNSMNKQLESLFTQIANGIGQAILGGGSGIGGTSAAQGGIAAVGGQIGGAVLGMAPVGAVTRASIPDVGATGDIASYIAKAASARGIDPNIALKVAKSEGGLSSWNLQSNFVKNGVQEPSFGPFQLYKGGGLGNDFMKQTGLDPALAANGPAGVNFALDHAAENGWGAWYGAKRAGIGNFEGIGSGASGMGTATDAVNKLAESAGSATKGLDTLGGGFNKLGESLSTSFFPSAPSAPAQSGGGIGGLFSSLFGGGLSSAQIAKYTPMVGLFADGGPVSGPGNGTSDSIPTMLSNGEFVVNARSSRKHRAILHAINSGSIGHMADGGVVRSFGAPVAPTFAGKRAAANTNQQPGMLQVYIDGANGDDHVRMLVKQGVSDGLGQYNDQQKRGGIGVVQGQYSKRKG